MDPEIERRLREEGEREDVREWFANRDMSHLDDFEAEFIAVLEEQER